MTEGARELFERGLNLLLAKDMRRFVELFAVDAELELPFAVAGTPGRLRGRAQLHDYLADYPERLDIHEFPAVVVHETTDPATIIVEFTASGTTVRTGERYELAYIAVIRARDGAIVGWRDYWSPVAGAIATGTLPELLDALRSNDETDGAA
ncbi:nuclear transport factor 2 family protein [Nocardia arthritidis]|uniref:Nuclear transport factor 2 family protein n=1 Tax=Nocardia arthritidis TaxID=228602 RepID=A0A6G9YST8_9NOCA|nr:nuclear transport factor 2 family protein [Nocardia arthritidis]QIS16264.1 nuclear transport factor 2 family protein [Nocardia arthritidis]